MAKSKDEVKVYGVNACRAVFKTRPDDIIRAYVTEERLKLFKDLLQWCASRKKAYHVVESDDLKKIAASTHHEGVCLLTRRQPKADFDRMIKSLKSPGAPACLVYLEGVGNPHNLGAIIRTCAHFGIQGILADAASLPDLSPSAMRVAQGGAEMVSVVPLEDPTGQLGELRGLGFEILAAAGAGPANLFELQLPKRTIFMFGSELYGLSKKALALADRIVAIPGAGTMESLNVSCAAAIFMAERERQVRQAKVTP